MAVENTTTNNAFPYPTSGNNGTNFAQGIVDFANGVDAMWLSGTLAARPGASKINRRYYATDTGLLYQDNGSTWKTMAYAPNVRAVTTSTTAVNGDFVIATTGSAPTITTPTALAGAVFEVFVQGDGAATVTAATGGIYAMGPAGAGGTTNGVTTSSVSIGPYGGYARLVCDGTNWMLGSGQQDTGWVALTLTSGITSSAGYTAAARVRGDGVELCGILLNTTGSLITTPATVPAGFRPASLVGYGSVGGASSWSVSTSGTITIAVGIPASSSYGLDSINYRLS